MSTGRPASARTSYSWTASAHVRGREAAAKRCEKQRSAALPCVGFEELSSNKKTPHADAERRRVHREKEADAARHRRGEHRKEEA
jgi:hypothetical protein